MDRAGRFAGVVSSECAGKPLRAPNDLTLDMNGGFYFNHPGGSREAPIGTVHYVNSQGKTLLSAGGMLVPNGLVTDPSGEFLLSRVTSCSSMTPHEQGNVRSPR